MIMKYAYYHMQHVRRVREADRSRATRGARVSGPQSSDKAKTRPQSSGKAVLQIRVFETPVLLHLRLFKTGPNRVNSTSRRRAGNSPKGFRRSSLPLLPNIHTTGRSSTTMHPKHEIISHSQGPRIKTNGSLPRDGKRLPSPSRAIPNSPLLSPPASAELDAGGP